MLKFTYTENGINLELLNESLDDWVADRVILAVRAGISIFVEPSTASFLLPYDSEILLELGKIEGEELDIYPSDDESLEVSIKGTWVVSDSQQQEGVFVTMLDPRLEKLLFRLWLRAEVNMTAITD